MMKMKKWTREVNIINTIFNLNIEKIDFQIEELFLDGFVFVVVFFYCVVSFQYCFNPRKIKYYDACQPASQEEKRKINLKSLPTHTHALRRHLTT